MKLITASTLSAVAAMLVPMGLVSCAPGSSVSVGPDGQIVFSGSYKPKGVITEVRDEK